MWTSSCGLDHLPRCSNTHLGGCTTCGCLQRMFKVCSPGQPEAAEHPKDVVQLTQ